MTESARWRRRGTSILGAPREQVSGGHPIPRLIEKLRMKVEREPKWGLHDAPSDAAVARSPVPSRREALDGRAEIIGTHEQIDVGQVTLTRIVVEPMLKERALDRHHLNTRPGERPRRVADELGREHRGGCAAPDGVSVYCGLRHFGVLPQPGIKQTASVV